MRVNQNSQVVGHKTKNNNNNNKLKEAERSAELKGIVEPTFSLNLPGAIQVPRSPIKMSWYMDWVMNIISHSFDRLFWIYIPTHREQFGVQCLAPGHRRGAADQTTNSTANQRPALPTEQQLLPLQWKWREGGGELCQVVETVIGCWEVDCISFHAECRKKLLPLKNIHWTEAKTWSLHFCIFEMPLKGLRCLD